MGFSLDILPVEIIYCVFDKLNDKQLFMSMCNVCQRLNLILNSYKSNNPELDLKQNQIGVKSARNLSEILQSNIVR